MDGPRREDGEGEHKGFELGVGGVFCVMGSMWIDWVEVEKGTHGGDAAPKRRHGRGGEARHSAGDENSMDSDRFPLN